MNDPIIAQSFFSAATAWICKGYAASIRYVILKDSSDRWWLSELAIVLVPIAVREDFNFSLNLEHIKAGQIQLNSQNQFELFKICQAAALGRFILDEETYFFYSQNISYQSDMRTTDRWNCDLHLLAVTADGSPSLNIDFSRINNQLRLASVPFDGISDLCGWLAVGNPNTAEYRPSAVIRVSPPVDWVEKDSHVSNNSLQLKVVAHPSLDVKNIGVAIRVVPGRGIAGRMQVGNMIKWDRSPDAHLGTLQLSFENAVSVLIMISLAHETVRRHWLLDASKAQNVRLAATKTYDAELSQVRRAIFDSNDSRRFELAIASLLYMLGFSPAPQIETEAPDLIVSTPAGRLIIVECTLRIADFRSKLGKLVDRRNTLQSVLKSGEHNVGLYAVLICALPRSQIVFSESELRDYKIILLAKENLEEAFARLPFAVDADALFSELNLNEDEIADG